MKADSPNVLSFPVPLWLCATAVVMAWLGGTISEYNSATKQHFEAQGQSPGGPGQYSPPLPGTGSSKTDTGPASGENSAGSSSGFSPVAPEGASGIVYAVALPPGLKRLKAFNEALEHIDDANWQEIAEATQRAKDEKRITEAEESWIYQRIGEVAGPVAIKFFEPEDMNAQALRRGGLSTLHGWTAKDPAAAWAYLEQLPDSHFRDILVNGYIRAAMQKDPTQAQQALQTMTPKGQADFLMRSLTGEAPSSYTSLAENWLAGSAPNDSPEAVPMQGAVFGTLIFHRMSKGMEYVGSPDMAGWLSNYAGKPFAVGEPLRRVIQAQSVNDPSRALSLVELLLPKDQPLRPQQSWNIVSESVAMLLASDPDAGMRWITERQNSPLYGPAVYALLAEQGASMNEATVQSWVNSVPDPALKQRILDQYAKLRAAPQGAEQTLSARVRKAMGGQR